MTFKGSKVQIHSISKINVGNSRIRHRTTLNFELRHFNRFGVDLEIHHSFQSRSMSDPTLSDINFKNKMAWTGIIDFSIFGLDPEPKISMVSFLLQLLKIRDYTEVLFAPKKLDGVFHPFVTPIVAGKNFAF